jgi:DNA-directed RNA polymerase subunit RPC12/RpoP
MIYKCLKCKKEVNIEDRVRCPFCGFRILTKPRPSFKKRILAR